MFKFLHFQQSLVGSYYQMVFYCLVGLKISDTLDMKQSKMFSSLIRHHLFRHFYCVMVD